MSSAGCIILAAGAARRMGQLKQLLPYGNGTLLEHAIQQACGANLSPVIVVVGAESSRVRGAISATPVHIAENPDWEAGMGSSITCGLRALLQIQSGVTAAVVMLADQPLITAEHLVALQDALARSKADAVAAAFDDTLGSPAAFRASTFAELLRLSPESGAKRLFTHAGWNIAPFPLPEAAADIDTPADLRRVLDITPTKGKASRLYDQDFYRWTQETAATIARGDFTNVDLDALADEVNSLGKRDRREIVNRLAVILLHMLKCEYQPDRETNGWKASISEQRDQLQLILADSPSLRAQMPELLLLAYKGARQKATVETGIPAKTFPAKCPYSAKQTLGN